MIRNDATFLPAPAARLLRAMAGFCLVLLLCAWQVPASGKIAADLPVATRAGHYLALSAEIRVARPAEVRQVPSPTPPWAQPPADIVMAGTPTPWADPVPPCPIPAVIRPPVRPTSQAPPGMA